MNSPVAKLLGSTPLADGRQRHFIYVDLTKYDPNQPRDLNGRWTSNNEFLPRQFISDVPVLVAGKSFLVYHGTAASVLDRITKEGLLTTPPQRNWDDSFFRDNGRVNSVFVASEPADALHWAQTAAREATSRRFREEGDFDSVEPLVLKIRVPLSERESFTRDEMLGWGALRTLNRSIPPEWIESRLVFPAPERLPNGATLQDVRNFTEVPLRKAEDGVFYVVLLCDGSVEKFNPYHDERGRFATADGASAAADGENDYRGAHTAPDHESGSPIYDVTLNGTYPADFYSPEGMRYYGTGDTSDWEAYDKIRSLQGKPDRGVWVYRAIPWEKRSYHDVSAKHINSGDWVAITRQYAIEHGNATLGGNFAIAVRKVPARELFTSGDSFQEWGWDDSVTKYDPNQPRDERGRWSPAGGGEQVQTPEFKAWFKDSKVVDAEGNPLVVYHNTHVWQEGDRALGDFTVFDRMASVTQVGRPEGMDTVGSWFSDRPDKEGAGMYASTGTMYPAFLSIQNPWEPADFDEFISMMHSTAGRDPEGTAGTWLRPIGRGSTGELRAWLASEGYDGIVFRQGRDSSRELANQTVWVALEPTQIKSAIGNRGTFDPNDPDLTKFNPYHDERGRFSEAPGGRSAAADGGGIFRSPFTEEQLDDLYERFSNEYRQAEKEFEAFKERRRFEWVGTDRKQDIVNAEWERLDRHRASLAMLENVVAQDRGSLSHSNGELFAFYDSDDPASVTAALSASIDGRTASIDYLGSVSPGAGQALMRRALGRLRARGVERVKLFAIGGSYPVYQRFGFDFVPGHEVDTIAFPRRGDQTASMEMTFDKSAGDWVITKFNPYHDERGRFATADGRSGVADGERHEGDAAQAFTLWHGTAAKAVASIKANGIKPKGGPGADEWAIKNGFPDPEEWIRQQVIGNEEEGEALIEERRASVFLSTSWNNAARFATAVAEMSNSEPVIVEARIPLDAWRVSARADELSGGQHAFRFKGTIRPEWITEVFPLDQRPDMSNLIAAGARKADYQTVFIILFVDGEEVTKFNPYHDERGRFATADGRSAAGDGGVTSSAAFKAWFGNSKVVDANGNPLVVYRGEAQGGDFTDFAEGSNWFTPSREDAAYYAAAGTEPRAFYLKSEKLLDLTDPYAQENREFLNDFASNYDDWIDPQSGEPMTIFEFLDAGALYNLDVDFRHPERNRWNRLMDAARRSGYDGVVANDFSSGQHPTYVVFDPRNIKSADRNDGGFDPTSTNAFKFNPNHDPSNGRFTFGPAGGETKPVFDNRHSLEFFRANGGTIDAYSTESVFLHYRNDYAGPFPSKRDAEWAAIVWAVAYDTAENLNFPPNTIRVTYDPYEVRLGGEVFNASGHADLQHGEVVLHTNDILASEAEQVTAHEIMHQKWHTVWKAYKKADANIRIENAGGQTDLTDEQRALHSSISHYLNDGAMMNTLRALDGVTPYSTSWWKATADAGVREQQDVYRWPIHETLAEIASLHAQHGSVPSSVAQPWQDFYHLVNALWPKVARQSAFGFYEKFNPNHDERGRFAEAPGGGAVDDFFTRATEANQRLLKASREYAVQFGFDPQRVELMSPGERPTQVVATYDHINGVVRVNPDHFVSDRTMGSLGPTLLHEITHAKWENTRRLIEAGDNLGQPEAVAEIKRWLDDPAQMALVGLELTNRPLRDLRYANLFWQNYEKTPGKYTAYVAVHETLAELARTDYETRLGGGINSSGEFSDLDPGSLPGGPVPVPFSLMQQVIASQYPVTKFNPYHDERGRFTYGPEGRATEAPGTVTLTDLTPEQQTLLDSVKQIATKRGYDPAKMFLASVSEEGRPEILGERFQPMAFAEMSTGNIYVIPSEVTPENMTDGDSLESIVAHEIEHQKWQRVLDDYVNDLRGGGISGTTFKLVDPILSFPEKLASSDGLTDYSEMWWVQAQENDFAPADFRAAVHETLAEIARRSVQLGRTVKASDWKPRAWVQNPQPWIDLYAAVEARYPVLAGQVGKFNPYHDERGRFATADGRSAAAQGDSPKRVSTRQPWAVGTTEDAVNGNLTIGSDALDADPKFAAKVVKLLRATDGFPVVRGESRQETVARYTQFVSDNLLWLHDSLDEETRDRAKLWYDGARKLTDAWSERYGIPDTAVAGVLASLSPQTDWFQNVSLAERVLDAYSYQQDREWSDDMTATADRIFPSDAYAQERDLINGKTLAEVLALPDDVRDHAAGAWIRVFSETYDDPGYRMLLPEGTFGDFVTKGDGTRWGIQWKGLTEISKAVGMLRDPSRANVSALLGNRHKVRSFYNNIIAPDATQGDVTIDTHAVAAALLAPLAGTSSEVISVLTGPPRSALTGALGTYGVHADAYRMAASARGLLPREMQSITWEATRGLFPAKFKTDANRDTIAAVWRRHEDGEITANAARNEIYDIAGGINPPLWVGTRPDAGLYASDGHSSYEGDVPATRLSKQSASGMGGGVASGDRVGKFNPYHDERGRFATADRAANPQLALGDRAQTPPYQVSVRRLSSTNPAVAAAVELAANQTNDSFRDAVRRDIDMRMEPERDLPVSLSNTVMGAFYETEHVTPDGTLIPRGTISIYETGIARTLETKGTYEERRLPNSERIGDVLAWVVPHEMAHKLDHDLRLGAVLTSTADGTPVYVDLPADIRGSSTDGFSIRLRDDTYSQTQSVRDATSYFHTSPEIFAQLTGLMVQSDRINTLNGLSREDWFANFPRTTAEVRRQLNAVGVRTILDGQDMPSFPATDAAVAQQAALLAGLRSRMMN